MKRCANCYHWRRLSTDTEGGTCHLRPPAMGAAPWPVTHEKDRCPEFGSVASEGMSTVLTTRAGPS